jgi:hypothetical protein
MPCFKTKKNHPTYRNMTSLSLIPKANIKVKTKFYAVPTLRQIKERAPS